MEGLIKKPGWEIKVGPVRYPVVKVDDLKDDEGTPLHGQASDADCEIRLSNRSSFDQLRVTMWHEVLHCFEGVYGLKLSEKQIELLAPLIVQCLDDNPTLRGEYD